MKIVHQHVFDPCAPSLFGKSKATDHAQCFRVACSLPDGQRCALLERGQCAARVLMGPPCVHGRQTQESGPTKRHKGLRAWIADRPPIGNLSQPPDRMALVGEYVWLPYDLMSRTAGVGFVKEGEGMSNGVPFIPLEMFTAEAVVKMCSLRPMSMFGGEIRDYQTKTVPLFLLHLSEEMPDLFAEVAAVYPRAAEVLRAHSNVGRKAVLATLAPNVGTFKGWTWDGEVLRKADETHLGCPGPGFVKYAEVTLRPVTGMPVVVEWDDQVVPGATVFVN